MGNIVTPLPTLGDVFASRDQADRELRISGHPEAGRIVLSIWQSGHCQATIRLTPADIPEVTRALIATLVPETTPPAATQPAATSSADTQPPTSGPGTAGGEATVHLLRRTPTPTWGSPETPDSGRRGPTPRPSPSTRTSWFQRATSTLTTRTRRPRTPRD